MGRRRLSKDRIEVLMRSPEEYSKRFGVAISSAKALQYKYRLKQKELEKELIAMERGEKPFEPEELDRVRELLRDFQDHGIPVTEDDAPNVRKIQMHEMGYTDSDGDAHTILLRNVELRPELDPEQGDVIRQAAPTVIKPAKVTRTKSKDKTAVIVPDLQGGYRRQGDELTPLHDESVVDVGLQIIRHQAPDLIVLNGDNLDFGELSHYSPDSHHFQQTVQATIDRVHEILAQMRASAPDAEIVWLAGNHEQRLNKQILNHNLQLWGLKRPGSNDDYSWLSVGHLMNLEELGVKYISGYPANRYLINDRLQVVHGDRVRSNGSTAPVYAKEEELSTIYGHVHRREAFARTNRLGRVVMGLSYGTWANTQGAVPSYGNGVDDEGRIVPRQENWQNGMGIIEYRDGDSPFQEHFIHIDHTEDYVTIWDRREFRPNES